MNNEIFYLTIFFSIFFIVIFVIDYLMFLFNNVLIGFLQFILIPLFGKILKKIVKSVRI